MNRKQTLSSTNVATSFFSTIFADRHTNAKKYRETNNVN